MKLKVGWPPVFWWSGRGLTGRVVVGCLRESFSSPTRNITLEQINLFLRTLIRKVGLTLTLTHTCRGAAWLRSGCCLTVGCLEADQASWQSAQE